MEIWKDIENYPGYQVSNLGRIRTHNKVTYNKLHEERHWKDRILRQKTTSCGRKRVELWNGKEHKTIQVHRIVANAFLGNPIDEKMTVNHIDGNPKNNVVENLEWTTLAENIQHGIRTGLYGNKNIPVQLIGEKGEIISFNSIQKASEFLGVSRTTVKGRIGSTKMLLGKMVNGLR